MHPITFSRYLLGIIRQPGRLRMSLPGMDHVACQKVERGEIQHSHSLGLRLSTVSDPAVMAE